MEHYRACADAALDRCLPPATALPVQLHQAMRYAVLSGGKRIRPVLVYATGAALGTPPAQLDAPACAVELIHAYSLVHDDLPAMDNDDLRRGQPTCHKACGEATAILAGDALQALAFQLLTQDAALDVTPVLRLRMIEILAEASGSRGMAGGQALDLAAVGSQLTLAELEYMHIHKTGALIRAAVRLGALGAVQESDPLFAQLDRYAKCIGLAFQIHDDVLDEEGSTATLGKVQGADRRRHKPTYPALLGLSQSRQMARDLCDEAVTSLNSLDSRAEPLRNLARYIVERSN
ncbi:MAG: (2E,6E)-farnesyl diphosphate synthase [Gammaproteobacteria bacterium]|nr:(2E,6E)-farnesyl diphosphate synthase [Gammaproteobacteria bacterium]